MSIMKRVIVLRGLSGSGKTTVAKQLAEAVQTATVVSADDYLLEDGEYVWAREKLNHAHDSCFRAFMDAINAEVDLIIVDNTNSRALDIAPYMMAGRAYGYDCGILQINCDPEVAIARNTHGTPPEVITAMAERMANTKLPPWWDLEILGEEVDASE